MAQMRHVVFIGEIGAGKSSVINLFADRECAATSSDATPCTRDFVSCEVSVDGRAYMLWDTPGLNDASSLGMSGGSTKTASLKRFLRERYRRGELDLLVFCVPEDEANKGMSRTYNIFGHTTRQFGVPVVIAITHLERQQPTMETWWLENEKSLEDLGLVFDGHACLTCLSPHNRRWASQQVIRFLISSDFEQRAVSITSRRKYLGGGRDVTKKITAEDRQVQVASDVKAVLRVASRKEATLPQQPSNFKAVPGVTLNGGKDVVKKHVAPLQEPGDVNVALGIVPGEEVAKKSEGDGALLPEVSGAFSDGGKNITKKNVVGDGQAQMPKNVKRAFSIAPGKDEGIKQNVADNTLPQEPRSVEVAFDVVPKEGVTMKIMGSDTLLQEVSNVKSALGVVSNGRKDASKKSVRPGGVAIPQTSNSKVASIIGKERYKPGEPREKTNDRHAVAEWAKLERRNVR